MKKDLDGEGPRTIYKLFYINTQGELITPMCDNRQAAINFMNIKLAEGCVCWMKDIVERRWVEGTED
jgi:hypothetical protein